MRHGSVASFFRAPELHDQHRFPRRARDTAGIQEVGWRVDRLEVAGDDLHDWICGEVADVVGGRQACLVADAEQIAGRKAAIIERALDGCAYAATLGDDCDWSGLHVMAARVCHGHELRGRSHVAEAVRTGHCEAGFRDRGTQLAAEFARGLSLCLVETSRENRCATCASPCRLSQELRHVTRRHDHYDVIRTLRKLFEVSVTALTPYFVAHRIQRVDRARKRVFLQVSPGRARPAMRLVACAGDHDVARRQQGAHHLPRLGCTRQYLCIMILRHRFLACDVFGLSPPAGRDSHARATSWQAAARRRPDRGGTISRRGTGTCPAGVHPPCPGG